MKMVGFHQKKLSNLSLTIITKNTSANAIAIKKKKRLSAVEKAILCYGASRIIDLSVHMKQWFSLKDRLFVIFIGTRV